VAPEKNIKTYGSILKKANPKCYYYSVATKAPPIPSYIFKMERDRLNNLWKLKNK